MLKSVRNSAGNVLLQILAATAVMSTSFYFLTNYVIGQREQVGKTANLVNLRFALNSAMDYVIFGVRQKYCFTNDDMLLNDTPDKCNLVHSGSIERLIMSTEQENFIRQLIASGASVGPVDANNISLGAINRYIRVSSASTSHPLFPVLNNLKMVKDGDGNPVKVDGISVDIEKDTSPYLPKAGREVYLKIHVALKTSRNSTPIEMGKTTMLLNSQLVIYPREVGSFALLVPRDLHLDTSWDANMEAGDVSFHKFGGKSELGTSPGLVFQSPVFVNRDLYLPFDAGSETDTTGSAQYSAVTFADRVFLGNGWVKTNGTTYAPRSMGGLADRYWSDARTFGGFLKGIENDGGLDRGLEVFRGGPGSGSSDGSYTDSLALMKKCIEYDQMKASKDNLYKSGLGANLTKASTTEFDYRLFLSRGNEFVRQWNALAVNDSSWGNGKVSLDEDAIKKGGAVINFRIDVADRYVEVQLPREGYVKITAPVGSPKLQQDYLNAKNTAEAAYAAERKKYESLTSQLAEARSDLKDAEAKLAAEEAKPEEPKKSSGGASGGTTTQVVQKEAVKEDSGTAPSSGETTSPSGSGSSSSVDYQDPALIASLEKEIKELKSVIADLNNNKIPAQDSLVNSASKNADMAKSDYNAYMNLVANPPVIEVETSRVRSKYGFYSPDKLDIEMNITNAKSFIDSKGNLVAPVVGVKGYDGTYYQSNPITNPANSSLQGYVNFTFNALKTALEAPYSVSRTPNSTAVNLAEGDADFGSLAEQCRTARNSQASQSFGGAGWSTDFSGSTRLSWNFAGDPNAQEAGKDPVLDEFVMKNFKKSNATFQVRSIVGKCVIDSTSDFVTGFFACDSLEITSRSTPLRIIGTFIASKVRVHPNAIKAGISWSSIYAPQATRELRAAQVLKSFSGRDCNAKSADPIWHPIPSVKETSDRMMCNTISLRARANPFQWTAVDPDCGIPPGATSSNTTCKKRLVRFFVVEQSREGGI